LIKYYPGSIKGPNPEDDPKAYVQWFLRSRPQELQEEDPFNDFRSVGGKVSFLPKEKETEEDNKLVLDLAEDYFTATDVYPSRAIKGCFIQMLTDKDQYPGGEAPTVVINSNTGPKTLPPIPPNLTNVFQYMNP